MSLTLLLRPIAGALLALLATTGAWAQSATYAIDPTHTWVVFEVDHYRTSTLRARFDKKQGTVQFDKAGKSGRVELLIDPASVSSGTPPFDGFLKGPPILDVANHPEVKFVGDKFNFDGDKVASVEGRLTLRGKTEPITLTARRFGCYQHPMLQREVCGGDFDAVLNHSRWGITFGLNMGMSDAVRLVISVEAIRQ